MKLQIEITKEFKKASILNCVREDRTSTYASLYPNLEIHDIAHFVVETNLKYTNAFYGLLAQGYAISDFQLPPEERPEALKSKNLSAEALVTEHMVNILQTMYKQYNSKTDFLQLLFTILKENQLAIPKGLTPEKFNAMYQQLKELMLEWQELSFTQKLKLNFEV